jgi:lipopolysaccharide transport system ATP-binding protein
MRLRLAYALAVAIEPDILIADEILAVGDEAFQRKCSLHIVDFLARGGTMILASHNLYQVEKLCDAALWLDRGQVVEYGPARAVTAAYRARIETAAETGSVAESRSATPAEIEIHEEGAHDRLGIVTHGAPLVIRLPSPLAFAERARSGHALEIARPDGTVVVRLPRPDGKRILRLPNGALLPGRYVARLRARAGKENAPAAVLAESGFECRGESRELGSVRLPHVWE